MLTEVNMPNLFKQKTGNEILQVLVVVAVIGALAITICVIISNKFKDGAKSSTNQIGDNLQNSIDGALSIDQDTHIGSDGVYE